MKDCSFNDELLMAILWLSHPSGEDIRQVLSLTHDQFREDMAKLLSLNLVEKVTSEQTSHYRLIEHSVIDCRLLVSRYKKTHADRFKVMAANTL